MNRTLAIGIGSFAVIAFIVFVFTRPGGDPSAEATSSDESRQETPPIRASSTDSGPEAEPAEEELAHMQEPEPIHYTEDGFDPHDQPITHWVRPYRPGEIDEGYTMQNVSLTDKGFQLDPPPEGHEGPHIGVVESPPLEADFPFNAVAPQWQEELPNGTSMLVELQFSPDGENWSSWYQTEVDHALVGGVDEYLPDGTPNEAYDYTLGGLLSWGDRLWTHFRYSIAFYSETGETPSLAAHRFFFNDSTLGRGEIFELTDDGFDGYSSSAEQE